MLLKDWWRLGHKNGTNVKENWADMDIPLVPKLSAAGKYQFNPPPNVCESSKKTNRAYW
jgi:hypothetical protein